MDRSIIDRVDEWAKDNAKDDYWYGSRQSYWAAALSNKVITIGDYENAKDYYGRLWTYRGD
jgi:hypothetical protein